MRSAAGAVARREDFPCGSNSGFALKYVHLDIKKHGNCRNADPKYRPVCMLGGRKKVDSTNPRKQASANPRGGVQLSKAPEKTTVPKVPACGELPF